MLNAKISYDWLKGTAEQVLGSIPCYKFEGSFDEITVSLKDERKFYEKKFVKKADMVSAKYVDFPNEYRFKKVQFDSLILTYETAKYDESPEYVVHGIRSLLPEEIAAFEAQNKKNQEQQKIRDQQEYKRLKTIYECEAL